MFTTQPDGEHDGPLEPLANIKTGLFVSTSEKLQNAEHNRVCCTEKETGACFIVVRFQKCPLLYETFQILKEFVTLSTGNCLSDTVLGTVIVVQRIQMCYL